MTDLLIDQTANALVFRNGDLVLTTPGVEDVAQRLALRLGLFLGEWFLNTRDGTPWREQILVRPAVLPDIRAILLNRIATCKGVAEVLQFDVTLDRATRRLSYTLLVRTDDTVAGFEGTEFDAGGVIDLSDPTLLCVIETSGGFF